MLPNEVFKTNKQGVPNFEVAPLSFHAQTFKRTGDCRAYFGHAVLFTVTTTDAPEIASLSN